MWEKYYFKSTPHHVKRSEISPHTEYTVQVNFRPSAPKRISAIQPEKLHFQGFYTTLSNYAIKRQDI